jgi:branched-chain amino acid transport system substrate-binding protein
MQHHDAVIDPDSHHVQQTIYLATGADAPRDDTDYFKILAWAEPESVRATAEAACSLESYENTPSYDQG